MEALVLPEGLLEPMDGGVLPKEQVVLWGRLLVKAGRWEELDPLLQKPIHRRWMF